MPTALALSPHLDDAAFSCGGTLATLACAGWRVVVATVFTRSVPNPAGFALACQTDKGLSPEIDYMALRRGEDAAAGAALGATSIWLDLPEAPHRGYGSAAALFAAIRREDDVGPDLVRLLAETIGTAKADLILAPQAIGGHVDHVQVVRALEALDPKRPILWWRDFPYVTREAQPPEPFGALMAKRPEIAFAIGQAGRTAKRAACQAYASQLGFQFGGPAGLDARLSAAGASETFRASGRLPAALGRWLSEESAA